jgi:signal transduction histidine kinase/DNA-binding response OmpR family regulator
MKPPRNGVIGFILLVALGAALFGVNRVGLELKHQAVGSWLDKANSECQRITDTSLGWLSLFHAQLRGLASLFYGSEIVTKNEFLNALDLIEGVELEAMIPLTSVAYVEQRSFGNPAENNTYRDSSFLVTMSSEARGPLAVGRDLTAHPEIRSAILSAMDQPEKVIMGPVFRGDNNQMFTSFAIKAMNGGKPGSLVSVVNLSDFIADLEILRIPDGLNLRIIERERRPAGRRVAVITGDHLPAAKTVATAYFPTQSGQARWDYYWDVLPDYQQGPTTLLGTAVQFGGNALVLSVFFIIASLFMQNMRVNRLVAKRTEELVVATRTAEAANQAKSVFLANMSHELRTPLTAILGYSQLLQRAASLQPEQQKHLESINTSSEQLLALINDVLEISRIEAKQVSLSVDSLDLHGLIVDLEDIFRLRAMAKGLQFEIVGVDDVPRYVVSDPNKLRQVLINLLANAVKFTDQGGVNLRIGCDGPGQSGQRSLRFEVQDTGVGIAENELDRVFRYFEQTESGKRSKSGTGLGMAISRDYARMMGGDITVKSKVGAGSTFRFEIPVKEGAAPDATERSMRMKVRTIAPGQPVPRILVAEDIEESRTLLVQILNKAGFKVRGAVNGNEAVEIFQDWKPDLIWMDIRMPLMDGLQATQVIKQTEAGQSTIVIALTAHALEEEREKILEAGCDDFVRKPYRVDEILDAIARHLGLRYTDVDEREQKVSAEHAAAWSSAKFDALPSDLRTRLHQAVIELDMDDTLALIEQICELDAPLGAMLRGLARKLDFDALLSLLENLGARPGEIP